MQPWPSLQCTSQIIIKIVLVFFFLYPTQKLLGVRMAEFRVVLLAHWSKEKGVLKLLQDTMTQDDHKEMS